jgi:hypothetical protein
MFWRQASGIIFILNPVTLTVVGDVVDFVSDVVLDSNVPIDGVDIEQNGALQSFKNVP